MPPQLLRYSLCIKMDQSVPLAQQLGLKDKLDCTKLMYQKYVDMAINQRTTLLTAVALYVSLSGYFVSTIANVLLDWPTHWGQVTPDWTDIPDSILNGTSPATASTPNKVCHVHALVGFFITVLMTGLGISVIFAGAVSINKMNRTRKVVQDLGRSIAKWSLNVALEDSTPFEGTILALYFIFAVLCCWVGLIAALAHYFDRNYCWQPRTLFFGQLIDDWICRAIGLELGFLFVVALQALPGRGRRHRAPMPGSDANVDAMATRPNISGEVELVTQAIQSDGGTIQQSADGINGDRDNTS